MKSLVALSLALVLAGCSKPSDTKVDPNGPVEVVVPDHGAYTGAFMDFGDAEDDVTLEMIGTWFPWSGAYYGGAEWVPEYNNWKGPETFRRAYRYVVDRVRARGASNIKWMFHTNNYPYPYETWNCAPAYYPGSDYVDWLGLSVYGQQYKDEPNPDIPSLVDWPYQEMSKLDPNKPIMIAEWATGEFPLASAEPSAMRKPAWIKQGLKLFRTRYPRIKAALYWHERWQNADGSYSNLRVNSSVESLQAYRDGIAHPDWLGDLILRAIPKK